MIYKRIKRVLYLAIALILLIVSGCGAQDADGGQSLVFAASTTTGSFYQYCVPCCEIVTDYAGGVSLTAISTSGTKEGFDLLEAGEVDVVGGPGIMALYAYNGQGPWAGTGAIDFSIAYVCYPDYVHIAVPAGSDIERIDDLNGKTVNVNLTGSTADITMQLIFEALGIECNVTHLDDNDSIGALEDGTIDALVYCGGLGPAVLMEAASSRGGMRLLSFSSEEVDKIYEASHGVLREREIEAGYYDGVDLATYTVGSSLPICVSNDIPEEAVYQMVKTLEEHHEELTNAVRSAEYSSAQNTVADWGNSEIPLHPGAVRYFTEQGLM